VLFFYIITLKLLNCWDHYKAAFVTCTNLLQIELQFLLQFEYVSLVFTLHFQHVFLLKPAAPQHTPSIIVSD